VLRKALSLKKTRSHRNTFNLCYKKLSSLFSYLLPFTLSFTPAIAVSTPLGVVRSQDNAGQWAEITTRLQAIGVDYCIVDLTSWQQESDLNNLRVLFLPNVTSFNSAQAIALDKWMGRGGQVIATGPIGTLSQPEVRSQLQSLLGAYWGFANASPSTLKPLNNQQGLSSKLLGGVVIPTGVKSQTAAVWAAEGKPPAVIITDQSTFLGWRWGANAVASASLDTAWLQASLRRHGIDRYSQLPMASGVVPAPCHPSRLVSERASVPASPLQMPVSPLPTNRQEQSFWLPIESRSNGALSPTQVKAMSQELTNLIERVESTLLAADAKNSGINVSPKKVFGHPVNPGEKSTTPQSNNGSARRAIVEAKVGYNNFLQLVNQQDYDRARQQWLQARRALWDNYPIDRQFAQPEIRSMWLDRGTIVQAKSELELAKVFDRMAAAGINTVFFETVNASYPIYPSRIAPEQNPLTRGWDPLKAAVKLAHERNMELHAWVWAFAAANQRHNLILNQPLNYLGPVLSRHPNWAMTDRDGDFFDHSAGYKKAFLDPANPEVQSYLLALVDEIATHYDIDGIQLDYIRYPFQNPKVNQTFGYSPASRQLFKDMTGVDPVKISPSHPLWDQWTGFRIRQVDSFVAAISQQLKQKRPDLTLSVAVFPIAQRERLFRLQQNWEEWGRNGWVDMIVLMTYALDTDNLEEMTLPLFNQSVAGQTLLLPGLRLLKVPDSVTVDQVQLLRNMPTGGYALFAAENLTPNLQTILGQTQGSSSSTQAEPLPHRQPFKATAARYQALQREWSFLLANHQFLMPESVLKEWSKQADVLALSLNQLADDPSQKNFGAAQSALASFRRKFGNWMGRSKNVNAYQVQVWENRLETLDRLLNYGERVVLNQGRARLAER
jgi:uncharacterized lipoprotein YddW (UPF0748 family)